MRIATQAFATGLTIWSGFRPDLVEFLHRNAGLELRVGNVKATKNADGSWSESKIENAGLLNRLKRLFTGE